METLVRVKSEEREERSESGLRLRLREDGRLDARQGDLERVVTVRPCFPWSAAERWLSLRDSEDEEFALVGDPAALDAVSRRAIEAASAAAGFVLEVTGVLAIDEEIEVRVWRVETRQGPRRFQTRLDDWPRELPSGTLLLRDVAGDLYVLPSPAALDARSRRLLWAFVD
jgi:hypothetical protein